MAKTIHCGDVFPACEFIARGEDETAVLISAAQHWTEKHGLREIDHQVLKKARAAMHDVSAEGASG